MSCAHGGGASESRNFLDLDNKEEQRNQQCVARAEKAENKEPSSSFACRKTSNVTVSSLQFADCESLSSLLCVMSFLQKPEPL